MSDLEIPVFGESKPPPLSEVRPEKVFNPRRPNVWVLTPKGQFGDETCAYLIDLLRKRGSNAIILNEYGKLEFGIVERTSDAASESREVK